MKVKHLIIFLILFAVVGYFRERFFEHLNIIMAGVYRGKDEYALIGIKMPAVMSVFSTWDYGTLYYSKYIFTVAWVIVFYGVSYFTIKTTLNLRILLRSLLFAYIILMLFAGLSMAIGYGVNGTLKNDEYTLSRWLLGIAQSPIICLILLAAGNLYNNSFQSKS